ncbi:magnesium transporter [Chelativorans sp. ZYF759]|uniref:magnesium transporter n=1 Tax=Chelativorans sp. ZYF759 TaxID=2692213 RepID=UPI00145CD2C6|nr:magnesium transporter [Chelativorans sp. ZYF759]NMG40605.1 magnesium transporter [Chelativorans sp. ZYF759]
MEMETLEFDLDALIRAQDFDPVRERFELLHPADIAAMINELDAREGWAALELLPLARKADTFGYLDHDFQVELATVAPRAKLAAIVVQMNADERADLYNELSEDQREALMPALVQAEREDIRKLAAYEEGTAGAIMTSDYATLAPDLTATQALTRLRREAPDKETIYRTYVVDEDRKLIGSVRLQDLITAPARAKVGGIMETNTLAVSVDDDQEEVARKIGRYDMLALPVIDAEGRIVGIVTHDDALDVIEEETTDDFHRVGTVTNLATTVGEATIGMLYRARIMWLVLLVFGNIFSGAGISYFEDTLAANLTLMFFLPMLIASGGNAGAQSATLMVRALATGDVRFSDWGYLILRETVVALALGLTMAAAVSLLGFWRGGTDLALTVSLSMICIVMIGSLIGLSLPFALQRFNLDPATASAPLVTSIADVVGVVIYFSIATTFLPMPGSG